MLANRYLNVPILKLFLIRALSQKKNVLNIACQFLLNIILEIEEEKLFQYSCRLVLSSNTAYLLIGNVDKNIMSSGN